MSTTISFTEMQERIKAHAQCRTTVTNLGVVCSDHNVYVLLDTENVEQTEDDE